MRKRQDETNKFSHLFERIKKVRLKLDLTWDELAKRMDCNRSLFFQVKRGNCGLSARNLIKLQVLEKESGVEVPLEIEDVAAAAVERVQRFQGSSGQKEKTIREVQDEVWALYESGVSPEEILHRLRTEKPKSFEDDK